MTDFLLTSFRTNMRNLNQRKYNMTQQLSKIMLPANRQALCNQIRRIAIEAGDLTLDYFDESGYENVTYKDDNSPLTQADIKAQKLIDIALHNIDPNVPIVGEENAQPDVQNEPVFWLVDPVDGTKEFVSGSGQYTVNIALIENNQPVLGVVYAPVIGMLYASYGQDTAIKWSEDSQKEKPIRVREPSHKGLIIVSSKSHGKGDDLEEFLSHYKIQKREQRGSSLKMCLIAEGKADLYPRFGKTCEWDTAAAHAILNDAGGTITTVDGAPLLYGTGKREDFLNPEFIARSAHVMLPIDTL